MRRTCPSVNLAWLDIARIVHDGGASGEALTRASAVVRKRFQRTVEKLRDIFRQLETDGTARGSG